MDLERDFFAGMFDGLLLGVNPLEFVLPCALIIWFCLLKLLPLYNVDTNHTIGGCMFAIFFAVMGMIMSLIAPTLGGVVYSPIFYLATVMAMAMMSLYHWHKTVATNLASERVKKIGSSNGKK